MQFRRTGQRDERRRRVLLDEMIGAPADEQAGGASAVAGGRSGETAAARIYAEAATAGRQPPITCLIAKRPWTLWVLVLGSLCVLAGLQSLYAAVYQAPFVNRDALIALDVAARGSLAAWFLSLLLCLAAANSIMVYWLRSHKLDDYRGRYRVWLWTAAALLIGAVDAVTGLHAAVGQALIEQTGTRLYGDGALWWMLVWGLVFGTVGLRMALEMQASRGALTCLAVAVAGFATAAAVRLGLVLGGSALLAAMVQSTALLLAHVGVAFAVAVYCRFVYLDAQGVVKKKPAAAARKKSGREKAASARPAKTARRPARGDGEAGESKNIRVDAPHRSPAPAPSAPAPKATIRRSEQRSPAEADGAAAEIPEFDPETGQRLSKAERRRLRKQLRREKRKGSG